MDAALEHSQHCKQPSIQQHPLSSDKLHGRILFLTTPQPFYGPFSGTTRVSQCEKRTSGVYGARGD